MAALAVAVAGAAFCLWAALSLTFWLGSWQLLYHPTAPIAHVPADAGLAFQNIDFATTEAGQPQLHGWWIPGPPESRFTGIYLHGATGNIGDMVSGLPPLHDANLNLLVFDYRGYGASRFVRPSEEHWREDAESAIRYLTTTRHLAARSIVLVGSGLGANLALELAAAHPELGGVVVENPQGSATDAVLHDPRARLVPAHLLFPDRWDVLAAASSAHIPVLWFSEEGSRDQAGLVLNTAYGNVPARKTRVWLGAGGGQTRVYREAVTRWVDDLGTGGSSP